VAVKNFIQSLLPVKDTSLRTKLTAAWHWLTEPSASIVQTERRLQARMLMAMLLVLIILDLISLVLSLFGLYYTPGEVSSGPELLDVIALGALLLFVIGYGLSRGTHYQLAAVILIGSMLIASFGAVIVNHQDVRILANLVLGGLIAGLFLSARATAFVFIITFLGLLLLSLFLKDFTIIDNLNAHFFVLTVGGLVIMAASLRQGYLEQIDRQTQELIENEARLLELSHHDPLTGLLNRRYLEEMFTREILRAARKQYPIGIIMADIDHFKQFNDTHGHAAGDAVLVQVAHFLQAHVRETDFTCRYGGEEFLMILPEATREITQMRAEQIREEIRGLKVQYEGQILESVTLSLGVAMFSEHGTTREALFNAADGALYRAKHEGRNRVVIAW
jgi:diguanylate cyclase (GGDEF)-like protein